MRTDSASLAREYMRWCRDEKGMSPTTIATYQQTLEAFIVFMGATPLSKITTEKAQAFLARERAERNGVAGEGSPATKSRELTTLRSFYRFLLGHGVVKGDPLALVVVPKLRKALPKPIDDDVWMRVWGWKRLPLDGRVAFGLGYLCGFRRAEIITIGPHHVSPLAGRFVGFKRKGGGDDTLDYRECVQTVGELLPHLLPDPDEFLGDIAQLVEERRGKRCLIPWGDEFPATARSRKVHDLPEGACDPQVLYKKLMAWQKAAGVPAKQRFSPHPMRHSFVTNLLRCGVPLHIVSRLANHANLTTTMGYAKVGGSELAEWRSARRSTVGL